VERSSALNHLTRYPAQKQLLVVLLVLQSEVLHQLQ
jgi:hypothetical protein